MATQNRVKVWFPDAYTEAHRTAEKQEALLEEFRSVGIDCSPNLALDAEAIFCGTTWRDDLVTQKVKKYGLKVPVVHYCWDLYPWQLAGESPDCWKNHIWKPYVESLKECAAIVVPSVAVTRRVREIVQRTDVTTVKAPAHLWDWPVSSEDYVVDVMRKYPDPNRHAVALACKELKLPCVETGANLPWTEYQRVIAGCALLVSAYFEASTGSLALLEGYALGKPVLISNSSYHGGSSYFGERGYYFKWDDPDELKSGIRNAVRRAKGSEPPAAEKKKWVESTFNDHFFAQGIAKVIREVLK